MRILLALILAYCGCYGWAIALIAWRVVEPN